MKMQGRTAGDFQSVQFHNKMNGVWMIYSTLEVMTGEDMIDRLMIEDSSKKEDNGILSTGEQ